MRSHPAPAQFRAIATIFVGMSFTLVFISFLSYIIECYLMYCKFLRSFSHSIGIGN